MPLPVTEPVDPLPELPDVVTRWTTQFLFALCADPVDLIPPHLLLARTASSIFTLEIELPPPEVRMRIPSWA
jgi:hypothetical protein